MTLFLNIQVRDAVTGDLLDALRGQLVTVCAVGTATPVAITEGTDEPGIPVPGSVLTVGQNYSVPTFRTVNDEMVVDVVSASGVRATIESTTGARVAAEAAATSAQAAVTEAAAVAARTIQLKGNAASGISFWGTFTEETAPGTADGVAVGDLGVLLT